MMESWSYSSLPLNQIYETKWFMMIVRWWYLGELRSESDDGEKRISFGSGKNRRRRRHSAAELRERERERDEKGKETLIHYFIFFGYV